ncbi:MAG: EAL domain-containing protein [Candidatus Accumulibacter sp.]|nr:EAL domain-containing protein [Accumulibacter sp.]
MRFRTRCPLALGPRGRRVGHRPARYQSSRTRRPRGQESAGLAGTTLLSRRARDSAVGASIGISIFPEDGRDAGTLLQNADVAMARAKKRGSSAHRFYSQEMNQRSFEHLKLEGGLRRASERDELYLVYQPQLDLNSGRITGAEALLRWQHPERGLISPAQMQFLRGAGCEEIQGHYFSRPLAAECSAELLLQTNGCAPATA